MQPEKSEKPIPDNMIIGRNPVIELLKSGRDVEKLLVSQGEHEGSLNKIVAIAQEKGIVVKRVNRKKLDYMSGGANHQGVIAFSSVHEYCSVDDILDFALSKGEDPFLIICDNIEDSRNLGSIIRTAYCCGAHGVIIPKRRNSGLNFIVSKASSGALEYMKIARVTNLTRTVDYLKQKNIWTYAADMDGTVWYNTDFSGGAALVIGSEGSGVGKLLKQHCDSVVSIPIEGKIDSLNASVAAGVIMYEIYRQRAKN